MYLEIARRNLKRQKMRSILAIVGMIIGVMAISSIGIFGNSLKMSTLDVFGGVATEIIVYPSYQDGYSSIDQHTALKISRVSGIQNFIPIKSKTDFITIRKERVFATIYGINNPSQLVKIGKGSISISSSSCLVGASLAEKYGIRVGSKISVNGINLRVSGILEEKGRSFDINPDRGIIVSEQVFNRMYGGDYSFIVVYTSSINDVKKVSEQIDSIVNRRGTVVKIWEMKDFLESINRAFTYISRFLMAIAGVSLLVAGVSILNIMLMSTIERTREIGIMKAIGASRKEILTIFLLEAILLGIIGSVLGGLMSIAGGYAIDMLILKSAKYVFVSKTFLYIAQGITFGLITAVISGLYPAWKASNLKPIEALRYE